MHDSQTAHVTELWRYPVKSLQGEQVQHTDVTDVIPHDRAWGIVDDQTGHLLSAKRLPVLLQASARVVDGECVITLPDGTETGSSAGDEPDTLLSAWLERPVHLATPDTGQTSTIEIDWDEGQDDPGALPLLQFSTQPGWFFDSSSSLHVISTATLRHLDATVGPGAGNVRRFRPNIVVEFDDADTAAHGEEAWVDATLAIGGASAWVKKPTDRCVVISRAQPAFAADRDTLRHLARTNSRNAGISAQPRSPGIVRVGDIVTPTA